MNTCISEPEQFEKVEEAVIDKIRSSFTNMSTGTEWFRSGKHGTEPELSELLEPITDFILRQNAVFNFHPYSIYYSVDTRDVEPSKSQRGDRWHIDTGRSRAKAYTVASSLPTQYLIHDPDSDFNLVDRYARSRELLLGKRIRTPIPQDKELEKFGLKVFDPEPFSITSLRKHIHRSPVNISKKPIERVLLRAVVFWRP